MADEQYRWLDRETAELLLTGQSLESLDATTRDQAERLAKALGSLSVEPAAEGAGLPGESAALAAFRAARADASAGSSAVGDDADGSSSDAGLVRIGRPSGIGRRRRWNRPVRLGLSAALTAVVVGGVAVAATSGVLPRPFGGAAPRPGASVAGTPDGPLGAPPSTGLPHGEPTPGASAGATGPADPHGTPGAGASDEAGSGGGGRRGSALSACRAVRDGRELGPGRRRALEQAAGGSGAARVWKYCQGILSGTGTGTGTGSGTGSGSGTAGGDRDANGTEKDAGGGTGTGNGNSGKNNGNGKGNGNGAGNGKGNGNGQGGQGDDQGDGAPRLAPGGKDTPASTPPAPSPSPTYSAL
ncbi:hypothetical protein ABT301_36220 [Streptomyces sp. NPDC000987]|uniref:hypothetical protein n=1 Tax=Streptomyces sp. NPDC000987 TaxID=3154374 RepID=UPI00333087C0